MEDSSSTEIMNGNNKRADRPKQGGKGFTTGVIVYNTKALTEGEGSCPGRGKPGSNRTSRE